MGKTRTPYPAEFRAQMVELVAGYETFADVTSRLPVFLEDVYNAKHMHSSLSYLSPNQFEDRYAQQAA
jgi:putative transposase